MPQVAAQQAAPSRITFELDFCRCQIPADFREIAASVARFGEAARHALKTEFPGAVLVLSLGDGEASTEWLRQLFYAEVQSEAHRIALGVPTDSGAHSTQSQTSEPPQIDLAQ